MLSNFDYLWKGLLCVCVCVNSTFGRCCDCCKKEKTLYFTKIDKTGQDENNIKKCFNNTWYDKYQGKVLLLKEAEKGDTDVLKVTGSGNKWKITDSKGKVPKNAGCNPNNNEWIIVKVITWDENSKSVGDSFIFYVDEITRINGISIFYNIKCYSIEIIAANISALGSMNRMFFNVESALEQDWEKNASPGLIGLDKLNVENVTCISLMFYKAIHKQVTLKQLEKWRFGKSSVRVTNLFYSQVKNLNFSVLDGWRNAKKNGTVSFKRAPWSTSEKVFVRSGIKNDFKPPSWYKDIEEAK